RKGASVNYLWKFTLSRLMPPTHPDPVTVPGPRSGSNRPIPGRRSAGTLNRTALRRILSSEGRPLGVPDVSTLKRLTERGLVKPPRWLPANAQYETIMGSAAYGISSETSDVDVYGWAIPPKEDIFPHLRGEVPGFGRQAKRFEQFQEHHVRDPQALA